MSAKFAAVTASLLARKGEAQPWREPAKQSLAWRAEEQVFVAPVPSAFVPPSSWKKCSVRLSAEDYERLGILAVKRNTSRQHLLQQAVGEFFERAGMQYGNCACLGKCSSLCAAHK